VLYAYDKSLAGRGTGNTVENNASIVLRLQYGEKVFLFMGDAEGKSRPSRITKHTTVCREGAA
jgi:beta-lactamase superfamily II metal-dependent hydrolase